MRYIIHTFCQSRHPKWNCIKRNEYDSSAVQSVLAYLVRCQSNLKKIEVNPNFVPLNFQPEPRLPPDPTEWHPSTPNHILLPLLHPESQQISTLVTPFTAHSHPPPLLPPRLPPDPTAPSCPPPTPPPIRSHHEWPSHCPLLSSSHPSPHQIPPWVTPPTATSCPPPTLPPIRSHHEWPLPLPPPVLLPPFPPSDPTMRDPPTTYWPPSPVPPPSVSGLPHPAVAVPPVAALSSFPPQQLEPEPMTEQRHTLPYTSYHKAAAKFQVFEHFCRDIFEPIQGSFCVCAQPNERRRYIVTNVMSSSIGWAHKQHDPCLSCTRQKFMMALIWHQPGVHMAFLLLHSVFNDSWRQKLTERVSQNTRIRINQNMFMMKPDL